MQSTASGTATHGRVDVLVNNAGVMPLSPPAALKIEECNRTPDVRGVQHGIAAVLPIMQAQGNGHFVNIASVGARQVWPSSPVQCASKFVVRAISDETARAAMRDFRRITLPPQAVTQAIAYTIAQPDGVDVSEIIVRPTASPYRP